MAISSHETAPPTMSQFSISACQPSDLDAMCKLFIEAFSPSPLHQTTYPSATCSYSSKLTWLRDRFGALFAQKELQMNKVVQTATGRLVAWARWRIPTVALTPSIGEERRDEAAQEPQLVAVEGERRSVYPDGANDKACDAMFSQIGAMKSKWAGNGDMYVLEFLATDPEFQRKGLGKMLMQSELRTADTEGKKIYLEASNEGYALYRKLGWEDVDELTFDLAVWGGKGTEVFKVMIREPQIEKERLFSESV